MKGGGGEGSVVVQIYVTSLMNDPFCNFVTFKGDRDIRMIHGYCVTIGYICII